MPDKLIYSQKGKTVGTNLYCGEPSPSIRNFILHEDEMNNMWNFDITKTSGVVTTKQLQDTGAVYCWNEKLNVYHIQTVDNETLMFATQAQGHSYIFRFEPGHSFELEHLNPAYESRTYAVAQYKSSWISTDGLTLFETYQDYGPWLYKSTLATPFDLTSRGKQTRVADADVFSRQSFYRLQFSPDGKQFIYKDLTGGVLYSAVLDNPYDFDSITDRRTFDLTTLGMAGVYRSTCFSKDGRQAVFGVTPSGSGVKAHVVHVKLNTPWDISTIELVGTAALDVDFSLPEGIAVNDSGTKMIVFDWSGRKFVEFNLAR